MKHIFSLLQLRKTMKNNEITPWAKMSLSKCVEIMTKTIVKRSYIHLLSLMPKLLKHKETF